MSRIRNSIGGLRNYQFSSLLHEISSGDFDFDALAQAMDCTQDAYGAGIIYSENQIQYEVRAPHGNQRVLYVVVSKVPHISPEVAADKIKEVVSSSTLSKEITSAALACGGLLLTLIIALVGTVAVPVTAGASGVMAGLAIAGTAATAAQCLIGGIRVIDMTQNDGETSQWLDSQQWYQATSVALDVVSLAAAGAALKEAVLTYRAMKSVSSLKATEWLKSYPRQDRKRLTELIIKAENPDISNKVMKVLIRAGTYPKCFPSEKVQMELIRQLMNGISSFMAFSGSTVSGVVRNPGSLWDAGQYTIGAIQSFEILS